MDEPDLSPGIARTVAWLQSLGYNTIDSGDGKTHNYECDRDYPYVIIAVENWVDLTIITAGLKRDLEYMDLMTVPVGEDGVSIVATYDPANNSAVIEIIGISDEVLFP